MSRNKIIIGTRPSPLAFRQVEEIVEFFRRQIPTLEIKIVPVFTTGDYDKTTPISEVEGTDFFTDILEKKLLNGELDLVIHSAKDLPEKIPAGLTIAAITESIAREDVLVSKNNHKLKELPPGAKIGTSSKRRKEQLKKIRPDLIPVNLRGNIGERLEKLQKVNLDGIIVARAALIRLGLTEKITEVLDEKVFPPHPLQGCLAIEIRQSDKELSEMLSFLDIRKKEVDYETNGNFEAGT